MKEYIIAIQITFFPHNTNKKFLKQAFMQFEFLPKTLLTKICHAQLYFKRYVKTQGSVIKITKQV